MSLEPQREAGRELDQELRRLRLASAKRRSSPGARAALLQQFEQKHQRRRNARWAWASAIAAALTLSVALVRMPTRAPHVSEPVEEVVAESADGFIAVPFVPPLAQGEMVRVVHTELHPAALAGLGVNVDPTWATALPADLLVGEDGFPRAVRVSNEDSEVF